MGERQLCKLNVVGSIPSTSTNKLGGQVMLRKILIVSALMVFCSGAIAQAACTPEEFQNEVMGMQNSIVEFSKDANKLTEVNAVIEKEFSKEIMEFAQMSQSAAADPNKAQEIMDRGCDLYGRINKRLADFK